jgi:hypothetical protein
MRPRTRSYPYHVRCGQVWYLYRTLRDCRWRIKRDQERCPVPIPCAIYDSRRIDANGRPRKIECSYNGETWRRTA